MLSQRKSPQLFQNLHAALCHTSQYLLFHILLILKEASCLLQISGYHHCVNCAQFCLTEFKKQLAVEHIYCITTDPPF